MEMGRHHLDEFHGNQKFFQILNNIAEYRAGKGADGYGWESEAWYGGDINRFWLRTEGEGAFGEGIESAEVQALYSHAIDPYWNVQGGLRYDFKPNPSRVYATVQLEGLAPSFFDVEGALFLSNKGELSARVGAVDRNGRVQRVDRRRDVDRRAERAVAGGGIVRARRRQIDFGEAEAREAGDDSGRDPLAARVDDLGIARDRHGKASAEDSAALDDDGAAGDRLRPVAERDRAAGDGDGLRGERGGEEGGQNADDRSS